jgi:hypothetical protein
MKKVLSALALTATISSCYTIKANEQHRTSQYIVKKNGVKLLVTEKYTRITTIDTLKNK